MRKKPWGEDTHSQSAASPPPLSSFTTLMDEWRPCVQSSWGLLMAGVCLPQEQDHRGLRNLGATRKYPHSSATVLRPIRTCAESSMATDPRDSKRARALVVKGAAMWRMQNAGAQRSALCGCCCAAVWGLSPGSRHKVGLVPSVLPLLACRADTLPEQILRAGIH